MGLQEQSYGLFVREDYKVFSRAKHHRWHGKVVLIHSRYRVGRQLFPTKVSYHMENGGCGVWHHGMALTFLRASPLNHALFILACKTASMPSNNSMTRDHLAPPTNNHGYNLMSITKCIGYTVNLRPHRDRACLAWFWLDAF